MALERMALGRYYAALCAQVIGRCTEDKVVVRKKGTKCHVTRSAGKKSRSPEPDRLSFHPRSALNYEFNYTLPTFLLFKGDL